MKNVGAHAYTPVFLQVVGVEWRSPATASDNSPGSDRPYARGTM